MSKPSNMCGTQQPCACTSGKLLSCLLILIMGLRWCQMSFKKKKRFAPQLLNTCTLCFQFYQACDNATGLLFMGDAAWSSSSPHQHQRAETLAFSGQTIHLVPTLVTHSYLCFAFVPCDVFWAENRPFHRPFWEPQETEKGRCNSMGCYWAKHGDRDLLWSCCLQSPPRLHRQKNEKKSQENKIIERH